MIEYLLNCSNLQFLKNKNSYNVNLVKEIYIQISVFNPQSYKLIPNS